MKKIPIPDLPPGWSIAREGFDVVLRDDHRRPVIRTRAPWTCSWAQLVVHVWKELNEIASSHHSPK